MALITQAPDVKYCQTGASVEGHIFYRFVRVNQAPRCNPMILLMIHSCGKLYQLLRRRCKLMVFQEIRRGVNL